MTWDPSYAAEQQAAYRRQLVSTTFIPNPVDVDTGTYSPTISMNGLYYPSVSASLSSSSESTSLQSPTSSSRSSAGLYSHGQLFDCRPPAENTWQPSNSGRQPFIFTHLSDRYWLHAKYQSKHLRLFHLIFVFTPRHCFRSIQNNHGCRFRPTFAIARCHPCYPRDETSTNVRRHRRQRSVWP